MYLARAGCLWNMDTGLECVKCWLSAKSRGLLQRHITWGVIGIWGEGNRAISSTFSFLLLKLNCPQLKNDLIWKELRCPKDDTSIDNILKMSYSPISLWASFAVSLFPHICIGYSKFLHSISRLKTLRRRESWLKGALTSYRCLGNFCPTGQTGKPSSKWQTVLIFGS